MAPRQRKQATKELKKTNEAKNESSENDDTQNTTENPYRSVLWKKVVGRVLLSVVMVVAVYWTSHKHTETVFAAQRETVKHRTHNVPCSNSYKAEVAKYTGCVPNQCGRLVTDIIVAESEAAHLLQIAKKGLAFGGSGGGASILDLHSGALSQGESFINIYERIKVYGQDIVFTEQDFKVYKNVRNKIQQMIAFHFGLQVNKLYLTHPTFFSEMTARRAKSLHDEYWHVHVDKETYPSFHYTSLLYLTDYGQDFTGGRFIFVDKPLNATVEPKIGRVSAFTSGAENPHYVEKVSGGTRYALTVSFTCDEKFAIEDPSISKLK